TQEAFAVHPQIRALRVRRDNRGRLLRSIAQNCGDISVGVRDRGEISRRVVTKLVFHGSDQRGKGLKMTAVRVENINFASILRSHKIISVVHRGCCELPSTALFAVTEE